MPRTEARPSDADAEVWAIGRREPTGCTANTSPTRKRVHAFSAWRWNALACASGLYWYVFICRSPNEVKSDDGERTLRPSAFDILHFSSGRRARSALENRQQIVGHLQDAQGHRGAVFETDGRVGPGSVGQLVAEQCVADRRIPLVPKFAAGAPHRLCGIIVSIKDVSLEPSHR